MQAKTPSRSDPSGFAPSRSTPPLSAIPAPAGSWILPATGCALPLGPWAGRRIEVDPRDEEPTRWLVMSCGPLKSGLEVMGLPARATSWGRVLELDPWGHRFRLP